MTVPAARFAPLVALIALVALAFMAAPAAWAQAGLPAVTATPAPGDRDTLARRCTLAGGAGGGSRPA